MDLFDQYISVYRGVKDRTGMLTKIGCFLNSTRHRDAVMKLRATSDKRERDELKRSLPLATISGVFQPTRAAENLKQHSGFICIDIDGHDNPDLTMDEIFHCIKTDSRLLPVSNCMAYVGSSVGGAGLFALVRLEYPEYHKQQFGAIYDTFAESGIIIDRACSDVCRLRCVSYNPNPFINLQAEKYQGLKVEQMPENMVYNPSRESNDLRKVETCCGIIRQYQIDITGSYEDWLKIGFALANLGEDGRYWFHVVSAQNPKYNSHNTDRKFNECLRTGKRTGLSSFFWLCGQYGISYARKNL